MNKTYNDTVQINAQNEKVKGTNIHSSDTIRGCPNGCESCWAKRNSCRSIEHFEKPIKVNHFKGKVKQDDWYRFGNQGDPAIDWEHSEKVVKKLNIKKFFAVTKLLSLKGFTGYFKNLQVSVDPLNKTHFFRTLENVTKLMRDFPETRIVLRVRSCSTYDVGILILQDTIVKFANERGLPIMETRVRFNNKSAFEKYSLVKEDYHWNKGYYRPKNGLIFLTGVERYYDCDLYGLKCKNCSNCTSTWEDVQFHKKGNFIAPHREKEKYHVPQKIAA